MKNFSLPPLTSLMVNLVEEIGEQLGALGNLSAFWNELVLRRLSRVRSIQGSLEIEGNSLSVQQVTAVLDGDLVISNSRDVLEVKNAVEAYDLLSKWSAESSSDLLAAHRILMAGLIEDAGKYRRRAVGVKGNGVLVHVAPPAHMVHALMKELFDFVCSLDLSPLITSSIFHYEFEYIHPFSDGNGRLGRLWQNLMLYSWKPVFQYLPIESVIRDNRKEYYLALNKSNRENHSGSFVEFMLQVILDTLNSIQETPVMTSVAPPVKKLLFLLEKEDTLGNKALLLKLQLKDRRRMRETYIKPAMALGYIEYTIPEKPHSRYQQYRLTVNGIQFVKDVK
ncbi:MAG: Fic family protein [Candidatus Sabulitectum sp.]|nr:Fic family protein [Candidatus Sabulitectum sp.]